MEAANGTTLRGTCGHLSASELAEAADENFVVHASAVAERVDSMRVGRADKLIMVDSGLECDMFNFVCRARLTSAEADEWIRRALRFFGESGHPFSWWVGPGDRPDDLGERLIAAGLQRAETELAMAADLTALPVQEPMPEGLCVQRVRTPAALARFADLAASNWNPPDLNVVRFYQVAAGRLLSPDSPQWFYLGFIGDQAVATAEMTLGGGVAGLYNISTRPPFRRRGIGTAMTVVPLLDARAQGYRIGVLQAAAEGVGVYVRVGFTHFGDITEYKPQGT